MLTRPRWTHIALPVSDLDRTIAFYTSLTPLVVVARHEDENGRSAWLSNERQVEDPFVLVLAELPPVVAARLGQDPGTPVPTLAPFAHIGIELPTRGAVDAVADRARELGVLHWEPRYVAAHVGYVCAVRDPDGNVIEFSHDQRVFETIRGLWAQLPAAGDLDAGRARVRAAVDRYLEALNARDPDRIAACVTGDFLDEHLAGPDDVLRGRDAYRARLPAFLARFAELRYEVEDMLIDGDRAVVVYRMACACRGEDGILSTVTSRGVFRFRVEGDRVAHCIDHDVGP